MANAQYKSGAFIFLRKDGVPPMDPAVITAKALAEGIDEVVIPKYAGDRMTVFRTLRSQTLKQARLGWLLRPIKREKRVVVYGVTRETKDVEAETLEHDHETNFYWKAEVPEVIRSTGGHPVVDDVNTEYQSLRGKIVGDDWTSTITSWFVNQCHAISMREEGIIYWCPPQSLPEVKKLKKFLFSNVGIYIGIAEIKASEREDQQVVREAVDTSLASQLSEFEAEVEKFNGKERTTVYTLRMERYVELKKRANLYHAALSIGVERIEGALSKLEQQVSAMLDLRQLVTVHSDGLVSVSGKVSDLSVDQLDALQNQYGKDLVTDLPPSADVDDSDADDESEEEAF